MKKSMSILSVVVMGLVLLGAAENASAQTVVTNFSNFSESGNLLTGGNSREQSFTPSGANVTITHVSGGGAGQEFYLSDEFAPLVAGDRISVDLSFASAVTSEQVGLALTGPLTGGIPNNDQLLWCYMGMNYLKLSVRTAAGGYGSLPVSLAPPDTLFIERTATGWSFGSISSNVETVHFSDISASPDNSTPITVDGSVLGFFSDMRSTTTPKTLSNLTVGQPSTPGTLIYGK